MKIPLYEGNVPLMVMLQGLPGSGKSTFARQLVQESPHEMHIHSSDSLRKALFGDENEQQNNNELFAELHRRIKDDLLNGIDIIYDATNINKKKRIAFLRELKKIPCFKFCVCMATPFEICLMMNQNRERIVPEDVIKRMYLNWQPPDFSEGFDAIFYCTFSNKRCDEKYNIESLKREMKNFDQRNSHHSLTLGDHCIAAQEYIDKHCEKEPLLSMAALLHDNGKIFTQSALNAKGEDDGNYHYYQHHCVGAYNSVIYLLNSGNYNNVDIVYISNLIYYHMHPYMSWKQSSKALDRDRLLLGEKMFSDIMKLHDADIYAH